MKLEVGMYARLNGKIGEITHICMCEQCKLRGFYEPVVDFGHNDSDYISIYWKDVLKASHNIIDLIEVGDYVNGYPIGNIVDIYFTGTGLKKLQFIWEDEDFVSELFENQIKSIVTKEQFENISYKIGD